MSMAMAMGSFRDSQASSWLSEPRTVVPDEPPLLIGPVPPKSVNSAQDMMNYKKDEIVKVY